jgi:AraC family transcriptional activator of pobA
MVLIVNSIPLADFYIGYFKEGTGEKVIISSGSFIFGHMQKQIPVLDSCTLSDQKDGKLLVDHFGTYLKEHSNLVFPHRHNFYHMVLFTKGGGTHSIDFNRFKVNPWQMYFMAPGQVHTWEFEGEIDGYVINFNKELLHSFLLKPDFLDSFAFFGGIAEDAVLEVPANNRGEVAGLCEKLYRKIREEQPVQWDAVRIILLYLFVLTEQNVSSPKNAQMPIYNYTILHNFQQLIEKHYRSLRLPKDYADLLFITPNHLNALCKEYFGMQAGEMIRNRILLEAKRLLVSQDMSIAQISYELNFNDNSYFTKFFKKLEGITPEEFKKQVIVKNIVSF